MLLHIISFCGKNITTCVAVNHIIIESIASLSNSAVVFETSNWMTAPCSIYFRRFSVSLDWRIVVLLLVFFCIELSLLMSHLLCFINGAYDYSPSKLFLVYKNSDLSLNKFKFRYFRATNLSTYVVFYTTLPHKLIKYMFYDYNCLTWCFNDKTEDPFTVWRYICSLKLHQT